MYLYVYIYTVAIAISTAPPPGTTRGSNTIFLTMFIASIKLRSISFKTSLEAPRNTMVQAFGSSHCSMKEKY